MKQIICLALLTLSLHAADNNENKEKQEEKEGISIISLLEQTKQDPPKITHGALVLENLNINDLSGLHDIPDIDLVGYVYFRNNKITKVPSMMFGTLHELGNVDLRHNNIKELEDKAFPRNIWRLFLSHNKLNTFNPKATLDCNALTLLDLSNNAFSGTFNLSLFSALKRLCHLFVDKNEINELKVKENEPVPDQLQVLSLKYNKLTGLSDDTIKALIGSYGLSEEKLQCTDTEAFKLNLYMNSINDKERVRLRKKFHDGAIELYFSHAEGNCIEATYYDLHRKQKKQKRQKNCIDAKKYYNLRPRQNKQKHLCSQ